MLLYNYTVKMFPEHVSSKCLKAQERHQHIKSNLWNVKPGDTGIAPLSVIIIFFKWGVHDVHTLYSKQFTFVTNG